MPNKTYAKEWLVKAYHDLSSAKILFKANHYTDTIGVDLHYSIEKIFKSFLAYDNKKIPKTHNLLKLYIMVEQYIQLNDIEIELINIATDYHIEVSYPTFDKLLPSKYEIEEILKLTDNLLVRVCNILDIDMKELK